MPTHNLKNLSLIIGWKLVNSDDGFCNYEYKKPINKNQSVSHLIKIYDKMNDDEFAEVLKILESVLPKKLRKKISKITRKLKPEDIAGVIEVISFAIEEYRNKTMYQKLSDYAGVLGLNLEKLGYEFDYELSGTRITEILSVIESHIPIEIVPEVGKIRKIDYKIAFLQNNKGFIKK